MTLDDIKATTIEEYLGTLQQSIVEGWKKHLGTDKYSAHMALNEYYDDALEAVDALIEHYQGIHGKLDALKNNLSSENLKSVEYFELLRNFAIVGKDLLGEDTELHSDLDNLLSIIDSTLYKLRELDESRFARPVSLTSFLNESIVKEYTDPVKWYYDGKEVSKETAMHYMKLAGIDLNNRKMSTWDSLLKSAESGRNKKAEDLIKHIERVDTREQ